MSFKFDYNTYMLLLSKMKTISPLYTFEHTLQNMPTKGFLLRHDVDLSINKALDMALLEAELNVKSTYFVLVTSDLYNINSQNNRQAIRNIRGMSHEIGLHFDPTVYETNDFDKYVKQEITTLEQILGEKVNSISLHNPSIHGVYPEFPGYINTYNSVYFSSSRYVSDSCKNFRGKDIFEYIEKGNEELLQIVLHPIHFSLKAQTYHECFFELINSKICTFDQNMRINNAYSLEIKDSSLMDCFFNNQRKSYLEYENEKI